MKYLPDFSGEHTFEQCGFSGDSEQLCKLRSGILRLAGYGNSPMSELMSRASILRIHDPIHRLYTCRRSSNVSEFITAVQSCIEERISDRSERQIHNAE